jgi:lipoprotein-releasing system ATP-binding protein
MSTQKTAKKPVCLLKNVAYHYAAASGPVRVLEDISFSVAPGERVLLMGQSGSGKSTLLHVTGLLDVPASGSLYVAGTKVKGLSDAQRTTLRLRFIGLVYQFHHLLPELTAEENVVFPLLLQGKSVSHALVEAQKLLRRVGLSKRLSHRPSQLSGGEQQRVALARALITKPALLLADEPTGSLDESTSRTVLELLWELVDGQQTALVMATHNEAWKTHADRVLHLSDGRLAA